MLGPTDVSSRSPRSPPKYGGVSDARVAVGFSRGFGRLRPLTPSAGLGSSVCKGWTLFLKCAEDGYHAFIRAQIRSRLKPIKGTDWTRPFFLFLRLQLCNQGYRTSSRR